MGVEGACLCGEVVFEVELPTTMCGHCHCTMCQRNHGAGYVTWFALPRSQVKIRSGESRLVRYASSEHGTRTFCGACGSSLFCESTRHPEQLDVTLGSMRGEIDRAPQAHIYWDDRADWVVVGDELPRLGGAN